jgi:prepilin-type N-terminal cleavage/methylation domain-containing protein
MKIEPSKNRRAFSLVELMIVITIIGTLSAVSTPALKVAMLNAQQNAAMQNAKSIGLGLRSFAQDSEGTFPTIDASGNPYATSNEAFRELLPDYIDSERIFAVKRSAWGSAVDGKIDEPEDRLRAGENHFAYISGLLDTSRSDWPLVVDGTNGSGKYTTKLGEKGGCWEGRKGIVITVGGSAHLIKMEGEGEERFIPRYGYPGENALDVEYMGETAQLLDPE